MSKDSKFPTPQKKIRKGVGDGACGEERKKRLYRAQHSPSSPGESHIIRVVISHVDLKESRHRTPPTTRTSYEERVVREMTSSVDTLSQGTTKNDTPTHTHLSLPASACLTTVSTVFSLAPFAFFCFLSAPSPFTSSHPFVDRLAVVSSPALAGGWDVCCPALRPMTSVSPEAPPK